MASPATACPLMGGDIAFLERDQRTDDGRRFAFDGADDILCGQQNFRTDGLGFRSGIGVDGLNRFRFGRQKSWR